MSTFIVDRRAQDIACSFLPDNAEVEVIDFTEKNRVGAAYPINRQVTGAISLRGQSGDLRAALAGGPLARLEIVEIDPKQPQHGAGKLTRLLLEELRAMRQQLGEARQAAAQLRAEGSGIKTRLREIESLLHGLGNPQFANALTWQPAAGLLALSGGQSVSQFLPISAVNISAVDLWFPQVVMPLINDLSVTVEDASGQVFPAQVATPDMGLETGWLRFALAEPIQGIARDCRLRVEWRGDGQIVLGLGLPVPDPRFQAAWSTGEPQDETLALRVWRSMAGVRLPSCAPVLSGSRAARIHQASFTLPSALPKPELLCQPAQAQDHVSTAFWEREDAILVHPSRSGAACAILRNVDLAGLSHVSALITAGHARAPNLNFAIGVAPHGAVDADGLWQRRLGPWVTGLPPHGWSQVHCIPAEPVTGRADLLLAASLATDVPNDFSWALFRGFRFSFDNSTGAGPA